MQIEKPFIVVYKPLQALVVSAIGEWDICIFLIWTYRNARMSVLLTLMSKNKFWYPVGLKYIFQKWESRIFLKTIFLSI